MVVGILQIELAIDGSRSLKDKRRIVSSLKDRLHREHQVSVAEIASQDDRRIATLGVVLAASGVPQCQRTLGAVLQKVRDKRGCVLTDHQLEILTAGNV